MSFSLSQVMLHISPAPSHAIVDDCSASRRISASLGALVNYLTGISHASGDLVKMTQAAFWFPEQSHKRRDCPGGRVRRPSISVLSRQPRAAHFSTSFHRVHRQHQQQG
jgi:hypothetical protein